MSFIYRPVRGLKTLLKPRSCTVLAGVLALTLAMSPARADDLQVASQLLKQGQQAQALDKINQYLASKPRDPQGRFLKGLILTEQNKNVEAIDVFTKLTQDYPELPEPYNNLAVLYAAQGAYEKARQSLEQSIRTHPSYATAYENLGDVYTKLASQAYDKALQLDSSNSAAKSKLSLVRELIVGGGGTRPPKPATTPRTEVARAEPPRIAQAAPKSEPSKAVLPAPKAEPATPAQAAPKAESKAPATRSAEPASGNEDVLKAVNAWAKAWAAKDVKTYLSYYARDFKTPKGESRAEWEKGRAQRIQAPKDIDVDIESPRVRMSGDTATVNYRQMYRSDRLKISSNKTLLMVRNNGRWLIQQERIGS